MKLNCDVLGKYSGAANFPEDQTVGVILPVGFILKANNASVLY